MAPVTQMCKGHKLQKRNIPSMLFAKVADNKGRCMTKEDFCGWSMSMPMCQSYLSPILKT